MTLGWGRFRSKLLRGSDALINLVGIKREEGTQTFARVHVDATRRLLATAKALGLRRFVHVSVVCSRPDARSGYHDTKWRAEQLVRASGLEFTILKPAVVYGPGDDMVTHLVKMIRFAPVFPVVGRGDAILQPVHVQDVALGCHTCPGSQPGRRQDVRRRGTDANDLACGGRHGGRSDRPETLDRQHPRRVATNRRPPDGRRYAQSFVYAGPVADACRWPLWRPGAGRSGLGDCTDALHGGSGSRTGDSHPTPFRLHSAPPAPSLRPPRQTQEGFSRSLRTVGTRHRRLIGHRRTIRQRTGRGRHQPRPRGKTHRTPQRAEAGTGQSPQS